MVSTSFNEENAVLSGLADMAECEPLSVCITKMEGGSPVIVSCWKMTKSEWEEFNRTGRIWLLVHNEVMPPVSLTGSYPFKRND